MGFKTSTSSSRPPLVNEPVLTLLALGLADKLADEGCEEEDEEEEEEEKTSP